MEFNDKVVFFYIFLYSTFAQDLFVESEFTTPSLDSLSKIVTL